jgi:hypothetical protein
VDEGEVICVGVAPDSPVDPRLSLDWVRSAAVGSSMLLDRTEYSPVELQVEYDIVWPGWTSQDPQSSFDPVFPKQICILTR